MLRWLAVSLSLLVGCSDSGSESHDSHSEAGTQRDHLSSRGIAVVGDAARATIKLSSGIAFHAQSSWPDSSAVFQRRGPALERSDRAGFSERWEPVAEGFRQSWSFPHDPAPGADLVVRVEMTGARAVVRDPAGLVIAPDAGGPLRYSDAEWIGADGRVWFIGASFTASFVELRVPASVLSETEFPALLDPVLSPSLDPFLPEPVAATDPAGIPSAACTGAACRVLFQVGALPDLSRDLRAAVLDTSGSPQTSISPLVSHTTGPSHPVIAALGSTFLAVWSDNTTVLGQRFDEAGAPLDAQPFVIATGLTQGVRVAASDNAYLVVWKDSASTFARLIGEDGSLLSSIVTLPITGFVAQVDEVTSDGVNFALAVSGYSAQFVLLDPSLNTVAEESIAAQLPNVWPAVRVGWDGSRYVVLSRTDSGCPITGLSAAGEIVSTASLAACANAALACRPGSCLAVFDANGLTAQEIVAGLPVGPALSGPGSGSGVTQLDLVDTPTGFGLVLDQGGLSWIALDLPLPAGIPSGAPIAFIARQTASPVVSEAANGTLVLATDEAGCKAVFVDASGTAGAEWSDDSFVCAGGLLVNGANGYLQYGGGAARLLDAAGQPSADVQLPSGAELVLAYWDGAGYTTVLEGGSGPVLQRFSVTGQPDGAATSVSSQAFAAHSMIATPSGGLISFYDSAFDTVLRPIDASGSLGPAVNLGPIGLTTLAWGTANGVVAWTDGSNMFALHVDQQGAVLDPAPLTIPISVNTLNGVTGLGSLFVATAYAGGVAQVVRSQTFASAVVGPPIDVPAVSASIPVWCGVASVGNAAVPRAVVFTESYSSTYSAMRAQLFYLDLDPDGAPCTEDDQCASGDCADGVCCSVDCGTGGAGGSGAGGSAEAFGGAGGGSAQAAGGAGGAGAGLGEGGAPSSGGSPSDGGAGASDPSGTASGCDCSLSPRSSTEPLPLLLLFALFSRRRAGAGRSARPRSAAPR